MCCVLCYSWYLVAHFLTLPLRYLPESMLIERGLKTDTQVAETAKLLKNTKQFDTVLARDRPTQSGDFKTASVFKP
jgi:hypothetical protein